LATRKVLDGTTISDADALPVELAAWVSVINSAATTTIKIGPGTLHTLTVTGGTAGTIVAYDSLAGSGPQLANFDSTNAPATYVFDVPFSTGLTVVTSAATKLSVSYR